MIKKVVYFLLGLVFLLIVLVVGLLVFINPNEYKKSIEELVQSKTGYELILEGDFNWHLWTKLSLVTNHIELKAPNQMEPFIQAGNLRLDLDILPLFSKKVEIHSILMNDAVVDLSTLNPAQPIRHKNTTQTSKTALQNKEVKAAEPKKWAFLFKQLSLTNSTILYGTSNNKMVFRNVNTTLQNNASKLEIDFESTLDWQNKLIPIDLNAMVDLANAPDSIKLDLNTFEIGYAKNSFVDNLLKTQIKGTLDIETNPLRLQTSDLELITNDQETKLSFVLSEIDPKQTPLKWQLTGQINSLEWNLNAIFKENPKGSTATIKSAETQPSSQSSSKNTQKIVQQKNPLTFLNQIAADIKVKIDKINWQQSEFKALQGQITNSKNLLQIVDGQVGFGSGLAQFAGQFNTQINQSPIKLQGSLNHFALTELLKLVQYKEPNNAQITGELNSTFDLSVPLTPKQPLLESLAGQIKVEINQINLQKTQIATQFNQQFIAQLEKLTKEITALIPIESFTQLKSVSTTVNLNKNIAYFNSVSILSNAFAVNGTGNMNLENQQINFNLGFQLLGALNQGNPVIQLLNTMTIPFQISGTIHHPHYALNLKNILQNLGKQELKSNLKNLLNLF